MSMIEPKRQPLTGIELTAWAQAEDATRKAEIAAAKASSHFLNAMTGAIAAADQRRQQVGLSREQAARAVSDLHRARRYAEMKEGA